MKIALFGLGVVGSAFAKLVESRSDLEITKIAVKNDKQRDVVWPVTTDFQAVLDAEVDVFVELTNDPEFSWKVVQQGWRRDIPVVTANKAMVAENQAAIANHGLQFGSTVLYESACAGAIPILRTLEEYHHLGVTEISGIINGSTNYILDAVSESRISPKQALSRAKQLGFAESDPWLDVSGTDPRNKLSILIQTGLGLQVKSDEIPAFGIDRLQSEDFQFAHENDWVVRLIAKAKRKKEGNVEGYVAPHFVSKQENWSQIRQATNALCIQDETAEKHWMIGQGAGGVPTAGAVLNDVLSVKKGYKYPVKKNDEADLDIDALKTWYVRSAVSEQPFSLETEVIKFWTRQNWRYALIQASLRQVRIAYEKDKSLAVILWPDLDT